MSTKARGSNRHADSHHVLSVNLLREKDIVLDLCQPWSKTHPSPAFKRKNSVDQVYCELCSFPEDLRKPGGGVTGYASISPKISLLPGPRSWLHHCVFLYQDPPCVCPTYKLFLLLPLLPPAAISLDIGWNLTCILRWAQSSHGSHHFTQWNSDTMCAVLSLLNSHKSLVT